MEPLVSLAEEQAQLRLLRGLPLRFRRPSGPQVALVLSRTKDPDWSLDTAAV